MKTMNIRRFFAITASIIITATCVSCGNNNGSGAVSAKDPDNITEEDFEKAAEKLESMSEEDFEKAVESKLGELDGGSASSSKEEPEAPAEIVYTPTDEIKNADFTSGLIQIGDTVFKCGGYMTVGEFVEKYGDEWVYPTNFNNLDAPIEDTKSMLFNNKEKTATICISILNDYKDLDKLNDTSKALEDALKSSGKSEYSFEDIEGYLSEMKKANQGEGLSGAYGCIDRKTKLRDAIVFDISPFVGNDFVKPQDITFLPTGLERRSGELKGTEPLNVKDFFKNNTKANPDLSIVSTGEYLLDNFRGNTVGGYCDKYGYCSTHLLNLFNNEQILQGGVKSSYPLTIWSYNVEMQEENLLGFKPKITLSVIGEFDETVGWKNTNIVYSDYQLSDSIVAEPDTINKKYATMMSKPQ